MIDKYVKIYNKRNWLLALVLAGIVFFPLFIVSLTHDVVPNDTLMSFIPFMIAALCVAAASLYTIRFKKMIEMQQQLYGVQFNDDNAVNLETTLYLSDDWLIWAGSAAIYKKHIKSISSSRVNGRHGTSYRVIIKTVDNKQYTIWCTSSSNIKKIRKWKNTGVDKIQTAG